MGRKMDETTLVASETDFRVEKEEVFGLGERLQTEGSCPGDVDTWSSKRERAMRAGLPGSWLW